MSRETELSRRIAMGTTRGRMALVDDQKKLQQVQVELLADETKDNVERFQQYGFTSVPLAGAEALVVFLGGGRDHGIVLAVDDRRYRLTGLENGDVALYTDEGAKIVLGRHQQITVTCDTLVFDASHVQMTGDTLEISASDSITVKSPSIDVNPS
jgi:phage baseplate assembly protein V